MVASVPNNSAYNDLNGSFQNNAVTYSQYIVKNKHKKGYTNKNNGASRETY